MMNRRDSLLGCYSRLLAATLMVATVDGLAQAVIPVDEIEKQLLDLYQTTKATADSTGIVTAGAVLVLQKDNLLMNTVDQLVPTPNVYKGGKIVGLGALVDGTNLLVKLGHYNPFANNDQMNTAQSAAAATRKFVAGEKFWVTQIETHSDGVKLMLLSDPISEKRYHATLKLPFVKGSAPSPDDVAGLVAEVVKIDSGDSSQSSESATNSKQQPSPAPAATSAAAPKTIGLGQSRDQVIATLGVPTKIIQLGPREIDVYPDLKVTFVQNQVVDVN